MTRRILTLTAAAAIVLVGLTAPAYATPPGQEKQVCVGINDDPSSVGGPICINVPDAASAIKVGGS